MQDIVIPDSTPNVDMVSGNTLSIREQAEAFLTELNALAIRLKHVSGSFESVDGLAPGGRTILQLLQRDGSQTVPQLARARSTSRQNIQVIVNRLHADGCVELAENPGHKRSSLVRLTTTGQSLLQKSIDPAGKLIDLLVEGVPEVDLKHGARLFELLKQLLAQAQMREASTHTTVPQPTAHSQGRITPSSMAGLPEDGDELPLSLL